MNQIRTQKDPKNPARRIFVTEDRCWADATFHMLVQSGIPCSMEATERQRKLSAQVDSRRFRDLLIQAEWDALDQAVIEDGGEDPCTLEEWGTRFSHYLLSEDKHLSKSFDDVEITFGETDMIDLTHRSTLERFNDFLDAILQRRKSWEETCYLYGEPDHLPLKH